MKTLREMTFEELVQWHQGEITLSIPVGDFKYAVWRAMEMALQWKSEKEKKE